MRDNSRFMEICLAAGLGVTEIALVESYIEDDDGRFLETDAYEKLFNYYCQTSEMPLDVAKAKSEEPDGWILDRLSEACKPAWDMV